MTTSTGINDVFRTRLRKFMRAHPDKYKVIAERAGYNFSHVRRVLSGERPNPTLYFVECMATALGVSPYELLKDE